MNTRNPSPKNADGPGTPKVRMRRVERKTVSLIGVPLDLGAGCRGVDMGPSAMRRAGIASRLERLGHRVEDTGNLDAPVAEALDGFGDPGARYLDEVVRVLADLACRVRDLRRRGLLPLVLGGDHSIAVGTVSGMTGCGEPAAGAGGRTERLGLLWVDAHADANTPDTSPSGNLHGMPVAVLFGRGPEALVRVGGFAPGARRLDPRNAVLIGVRSVDEAEAGVVADLGVRVYTMEEVDRRGFATVVDEAVARVLDGTDGMHLSLDMDGLDPEIAPGVGTPVRGGLSYREAHTLMEAVAESGGLRSLEVAEVNPIRDVRNQTAELAVELVASALGKRTLPGIDGSRNRSADPR